MRDANGMPIPLEIGSRQAAFDSEPELLSHGQWICLNVWPDIAWPVRPQWLEIDGHRTWIIPITSECYPGVAMKLPPSANREEAEGILYRLLSVISWRERCGITVAHRSGGSLPYMIGRENIAGIALRDSFDFTEIIFPKAEQARVALALIREARSLNHHGYAFLSYWRILELAFPKAHARVRWMEEILPRLSDHGVAEAITSIAAHGPAEVCRHLFESGRCAIAHATGRPIINPDDPRDADRLSRELPLVREMATRVIEERFGIDTPSTEYRKHLYELRGWKGKLGSLVERILAGIEPCDDEMVDLPAVNVRLRDCMPYRPLEGMMPSSISLRDGALNIEYRTRDNLLTIRFALCVANERLKFDIENAIYLRDDGSVTAAEHVRDLQRFFRDYLLNGVLQMWDADSGALLSRLDAFIPMNCRIDLAACNAGISEADAEVERRRAENAV